MNKQPEPLRLADLIERYNSGVHSQAIVEDYCKAAAELRRLHSENQALNDALQYSMGCHREMGELAARQLIRIDELESQGEQEPDAWMHSEGKAQPLYLHPQPPRQPLTVEQIDGIIRDLDPSWLDTPTGFEEEFCRAIERAHGIK